MTDIAKNYQFNQKDIRLIEKALNNHMMHLQLHGNPEDSRYIYQMLKRIKNQQ